MPNFVSPEAKDLMSKVLNVDFKSRYKIEQIWNHQWFKKNNYYFKGQKGVIIGYHEIPIDYDLVRKVCEQFGVN